MPIPGVLVCLIRNRLVSSAANEARIDETSVSGIHLGGIQGSSVSEKFDKPNWARYLCATSTGENKLLSCYLVLE